MRGSSVLVLEVFGCGVVPFSYLVLKPKKTVCRLLRNMNSRDQRSPGATSIV